MLGERRAAAILIGDGDGPKPVTAYDGSTVLAGTTSVKTGDSHSEKEGSGIISGCPPRWKKVFRRALVRSCKSCPRRCSWIRNARCRLVSCEDELRLWLWFLLPRLPVLLVLLRCSDPRRGAALRCWSRRLIRAVCWAPGTFDASGEPEPDRARRLGVREGRTAAWGRFGARLVDDSSNSLGNMTCTA